MFNNGNDLIGGFVNDVNANANSNLLDYGSWAKVAKNAIQVAGVYFNMAR